MIKNKIEQIKNAIKNNKFLRNKKVVCFGAGALAVLTGGIVTVSSCVSCTGKQNSNDENSIVSSVDNLSNNSNGIEDNNSNNNDNNSDNNNSTNNIDEEPVYKSMKAEDVVKLSKSFAEHLNKEATLSHVNYKFSEIEETDLYSVIYLANIDNISKEETTKLIENGLISNNIQKNVENSFYFYNLYTDDTINKIGEGKTNLIDLSLILSDKNDIKTFNTMNKIMTDSINNTSDENYKNYMDTVFYYASDVTIYNNEYDYSRSIYETDRDKLTVGGNYTLSFMATTIDFISFNNGVSNKYASEILQSGANDFANVVSIFNGCKIDAEQIEKDNQYTK